ncbi:MAG TPA: tetratricopeptide repeat protein [Lacunisphaera sp.]|nr:tetratricopeptide repeat protein [Lacunisphaera sp.]
MAVALALTGCTKTARMERKLKLGDKYVEAGNFKSAEIEYRSALQVVPDNPKVLSRIGIMTYHQGRPISSFYLLSGVRERLPDDLDVQLYYGLSCLSLARTAEARIAAKKVLEGRPDNEEALLLLVETCLTTRDSEESQRLVEKYREQSKGNKAAHHVAMGALLLGRRELPAAEAELRKALEIDPKSGAAHAYLGNAAMIQKKPEQAGQEYKQAAEFSPLRSPRRIKYVDYLMGNGALDEAHQELVKILDQAPDYVPAWVQKMKVAFLQGKNDESEAAISEVLSRDRNNFEAKMQRVAIKLTKRDFEGVIADLKSLEDLFERAPQVKYQLALAYLGTGNLGRAEDYLQAALRVSPNYIEAMLLLAEVNMQQGRPGDSITVMERLLTKNPGLARGYVLLAEAYRAQGKRDKSLEILQMLASKTPGVPDGPYLVGTILRELGRNDEARQAFEESLRRKENYWPAVEGVVDLDLEARQVEVAAARIKTLLEKNPNVIPPRLIRAKVRLAAGDGDGAEADLLKAIEMEPKVQYPYLLLARIYYSADRAKEALAKLTALAGKKPAVGVYMQLGMLYDAVNQPDDARASYEKALAIDPNFTPALNNLAFFYAASPATLDKAYELAKQAQNQRPSDPVVADTMAWILFQKGQYDRALRLAEQAADKLPADAAIRYRVGLIQYYLGQAEIARQSFQNVVSAGGPSPFKEDAARRLAILQLDPANPDPAIRTQLESAVQADAKDPVALVRLAEIEVRAGDAAKAEQHYEAVLKINPGSVPAMIALIQLDFGSIGKPDRARELAKLVRAEVPNDQRTAALVGHLLVRAGEFAAAAPLLIEAAQAFPDQPEIYFDLARAQYGVGRVAEAEKALETSLRSGGAAPRRKQAEQMAALLAAIRQPALREADLALAREVRAQDEINIPALMVLALEHEQRKEYKEAVRDYENILTISPTFAAAMRQLAVLYGDQLGDDEKAEQYAMKARQTLTEDPELDHQLGLVNYRRANYQEAARFLQQSVRRRPNDADSMFFLGMTHFQLKNPSEARGELQRALELKLQPQEETEARRVLDMIAKGGGL